jgi:hypothetical protein
LNGGAESVNLHAGGPLIFRTRDEPRSTPLRPTFADNYDRKQESGEPEDRKCHRHVDYSSVDVLQHGCQDFQAVIS